ncbi:MAG TPA: hypothetical protein VGG29_06135 [Caulobacteraceae bacterium]|jgi:hypothetical protein
MQRDIEPEADAGEQLRRKPWATPHLILSKVSGSNHNVFKLTPSVHDYTTGTSQVGS